MLNIRGLVIGALSEVFSGRATPREAVEAASRGLDDRDRSFLMESAYGVVRHRDSLDWALDRFLRRPSAIRGRTRNNLRLGAYQILHMRVPDWAAVNEAVELEARHPSLVNAVLRNVIRKKQTINGELEAMRALAESEAAAAAERVLAIATLTSHPRWLVRRWLKRFGAPGALALCDANNRIPPLTIRTNTLRTTRENLLEDLRNAGLSLQPTELSPEGLRHAGTLPIEDIREFLDRAYVQDEAAQLVSHLLGPKPGERVLDACAAPGGKTTHMAQLMKNRGKIVAVDISEKRLDTLRSNASALGISIIETVQGDMTALGNIGPFDRVLVDAPCSSLGVIRRNPDVKYRHRAGDLRKFGAKQLAIFDAASGCLKPGGTLVYCTCSTEPEEGEHVVGQFLKTSPDFINIDDVPFGEEFMRTYPHRHDMDGFFGARLKRNA
ncbi:MAG: 16S rRNA (cytosine(967)-C(5))-methyltransferase RsmB [Nitrospirota bacterium]|jgi:16S rRNA (cytosine967-C5)-methyltransferase